MGYAGELDWSQRYDQNRRGFIAYCDELRINYADEEAKWWDNNIREAGLEIPCYAEFYKVIQWHNLVCDSLDYLKFPAKDFYFEDFEENLYHPLLPYWTFMASPLMFPLMQRRSHIFLVSPVLRSSIMRNVSKFIIS